MNDEICKDEYLSIEDAASFLKVCFKTLRNWEKSGKIRSYFNNLYYKKSDIMDISHKKYR